jgi:assimilatory nitrate reductase catalytic subunit
MPLDSAPTTIRTTCAYCGVGCGVAAQPSGRDLAVQGDADHPANGGRLCSKGTALGATFGLKGRLLEPKLKTADGFAATDWNTALDTVAAKFRAVVDEHGPDAVAFYVSGQLLTEDYYAVNKLAKGYIGTANVDTNSRLCMSSAVAAHKQAFGADLVPAVYEDLEEAELLVFSGHNAAWTHPVLFRRIEAAAARHPQFRVCIDPKRTDTAKACDLHLMIRPQSDVRLWNGLAAYLIENGGVDTTFVRYHTEGYEELVAELGCADQSLTAIARDCDVPLGDLETFYRRFLDTAKTTSLFSMGSNQSSQGVAKGLSLINAHLLSGKIGKPGSAPFSITGQPNAMGGREVGGLANMLAAHMDFDAESLDRVKRFWNSPTIAPRAGLKAVDMFRAVHAGKIKAIWIMATNPMVSLPDADFVAEALKRCEMVVVSDVIERTDTMAMADVQLPAAAWGEKDGTVTNSERVISRQRALGALPGQARPDWAIIAEVAKRMGYDGFGWKDASEVFAEHAGLTAFENDGRRFFNLAGLTGMDKAQYDAMKPIRWPVAANGQGAGRFFTNQRFNTPSGKARLKPVAARGPAVATTPDLPLTLNSTRIRDQWHTMTRTALAPELNRHIPEPFVDIHPSDAAKYYVTDKRLARVVTFQGDAVFRANVTEDVRPGDLNVPMHWTRTFASSGRANPLINAEVDPMSGQPEFKHTPATIQPYGESWHGFVLHTDDALAFSSDIVWRRTPYRHCQAYEIAGRGTPPAIETLMQVQGLLSLDDRATGLTRRIHIADGRLRAVAFVVAIDRPLPPRDWLAERFGDDSLSPLDRANVLLGRLPGVEDVGPLVCACRSVGTKTIEAAIRGGCHSPDAVGDKTSAGTQCGSCRPEIARMIVRLKNQEKAHA